MAEWPHCFNQVVRGAGLEPAHPCGRQDLNLVRLPISPPARVLNNNGWSGKTTRMKSVN